MILMMLGTGVIGFIGQSNNASFYFNKLDLLVKSNYFRVSVVVCIGCELWSLANGVIEEFCVAWRKSL
jgi:hypothetical protein